MELDNFTSQFKSAFKEGFNYSEVKVSNICLITSLGIEHSKRTQENVSSLLPEYSEQYEWSILLDSQFASIQDMLKQIEICKPDLIVVERAIKTPEQDILYGLSPYIETITQVINTPILLLPANGLNLPSDKSKDTKILVAAHHLIDSQGLINWGVFFAKPNGQIYLNHIEDRHTFKRYIEVIEKIPEIDSDIATKTIYDELLKLPTEFIETVRNELASKFPEIEILGLVKISHALSEIKHAMEGKEIDLLIVNSKDPSHLAMDAMSYECAIEFKNKHILML